MSRRSIIVSLSLLLALSAYDAVLSAAPVHAVSTLVVAQDGLGSPASCGDATPTPYTTIGSAVAAANPNDIVKVCPGIYNEQVEISKSIRVSGVTGAVVMPSPMVVNTTSLFSGSDIKAVILVRDTTRVTIDGLTVDGLDNGVVACGPPTIVGIFFRNASGTARDNAVRNLKLGPGLEGCQNGLGIFVQSGAGGSSLVNVEGNSVHEYQKNGITGNEPGTDLRVAKTNVVTGWGPTPFIAQNGVQIGFGATGRVDSNVITNHVWTGCTAPSATACPFTSTDILLVEAAGVRINQNVLGQSQAGVLADTVTGAKIEGNTVFQTEVCDGIALFGDGNDIKNNVITSSGESGVFLAGNNNEVKGNRINEAPVGLIKSGTGNVLTPNTYFNVPLPDPEGTAGPSLANPIR